MSSLYSVDNNDFENHPRLPQHVFLTRSELLLVRITSLPNQPLVHRERIQIVNGDYDIVSSTSLGSQRALLSPTLQHPR